MAVAHRSPPSEVREGVEALFLTATEGGQQEVEEVGVVLLIRSPHCVRHEVGQLDETARPAVCEVRDVCDAR